MKIYLAGSLFSEVSVHGRRREYQIATEQLPEAEIFSPVMADFNEKKDTLLPTPSDIAAGDTKEVATSDYVIFDLGDYLDEGLNAELGYVAGLNDSREKQIIPIGVFSDIRRGTANQYEIPPVALNHFVLGLFDIHGHIVNSFQEALDLIKKLELEKIDYF